MLVSSTLFWLTLGKILTFLHYCLPASKVDVLLPFSAVTGRIKTGKFLRDDTQCLACHKDPKGMVRLMIPLLWMLCSRGGCLDITPLSFHEDRVKFAVFLMSSNSCQSSHFQELRIWLCLELGSLRKFRFKTRPPRWPRPNILNYCISSIWLLLFLFVYLFEWGRKGFILLTIPYNSFWSKAMRAEDKAGLEPAGRNWFRAMEGCCLLAWSSWLAQSTFL